jgi:multidrug resistance efflux pump
VPPGRAIHRTIEQGEIMAGARRTAAEIAQAELDKATARVTRAEKRVEKAKEEVAKAEREVTLAKREQTYRADHPDLQSDPREEGEAPEPTE